MKAKDIIKQIGKRGHLYWDTSKGGHECLLYDPHNDNLVVAKVDIYAGPGARITWMYPGVPKRLWWGIRFNDSTQLKDWAEEQYFTGMPETPERKQGPVSIYNYGIGPGGAPPENPEQQQPPNPETPPWMRRRPPPNVGEAAEPGTAKGFLTQLVGPPKLTTHKLGRKYGRVLRYGKYKLIRHDYRDHSIIVALFGWNPRHLYLYGRGEKVRAVRRPGWEELWGPVKLPPGANWVKYWQLLKQELDKHPEPFASRYDNARLPEYPTEDFTQVGESDISGVKQFIMNLPGSRPRKWLVGYTTHKGFRHDLVMARDQDDAHRQFYKQHQNDQPEHRPTDVWKVKDIATYPKMAEPSQYAQRGEAKEFIKQAGLPHLPGFYVRSKFQTWLVNRDGKVMQEWTDDNMMDAYRRANRFSLFSPTMIDAARFNVREYVDRTGDLPRGQGIKIHQIGYWGPSGTYFPSQDETLHRFQ